MADHDQSIYTLRFNQIANTLEGFGGGSPQWTQLTLTNTDPTQVPVTRLINTTSPLMGGGNLSADRTLSIQNADATHTGALTSTDWSTFNSKQPAGSYITALTGDVTATGPGSSAATLASTAVTPGSYTNASITVDAKGRLTAASSGSSVTPGGTDGDIQYNSSGAFAGDDFIYIDATQHQLRIAAPNVGPSADFANLGFYTHDRGAAVMQLFAQESTGNGQWQTTGGMKLASGTSVIDVNSSLVSNVTDPVSAQDAATKNYVDTTFVTSVSGTASDISSTGGLTPVLDLIDTAVTPGSYTGANITVDQKGRITAASSGGASSKLVNTVFSSVALNQTASGVGFVAAGFSLSYTATSVSNILLITAAVMLDTDHAGGQSFLDIFSDATSLSGGRRVAQVYDPGSRVINTVPVTIAIAPADTSAHTYDVYFNSANGGNIVVGNGGSLQSTMTIQEVTNP